MPPSPIVLDKKATKKQSWTPEQADDALRRLLNATLEQEKEITQRDTEIARVEQRHAAALQRASAEISTLDAQLEEFYLSQRASIKAKGGDSLELAHGSIGMQTASQAALVPLEKWTWDKIEAQIRRSFRKRFFHEPQPPGLNKLKLKKELSEAQLAKCGLKLERAESFYYDLNRLPSAA